MDTSECMIGLWHTVAQSDSLFTACFYISVFYQHAYTQFGPFNPTVSPLSPPPFLFHQETSIIHEGSQHPQRVMFPTLTTLHQQVIHGSQYFKSHNNKGVTLRLMHSSTHTHTHSLYSACMWWKHYYSCLPVLGQQVKASICLIWIFLKSINKCRK